MSWPLNSSGAFVETAAAPMRGLVLADVIGSTMSTPFVLSARSRSSLSGGPESGMLAAAGVSDEDPQGGPFPFAIAALAPSREFAVYVRDVRPGAARLDPDRPPAVLLVRQAALLGRVADLLRRLGLRRVRRADFSPLDSRAVARA